MKAFFVALLKHGGTDFRLTLSDENNRELSHATIGDENLQHLLQETETRYEDKDNPDLKELGQTLFQFLEANLQFRHHVLSDFEACVYFQTDKSLNHLPWEILHNGSEFLAHSDDVDYIPIRYSSDSNRSTTKTQNRPLHVLFMASSPEDVEPVLNYEQEEANILQATRQHPLTLHVEESGSLDGLKERLVRAKKDYYDVIHITGHADVEKDTPVFLLENEFGQCQKESSKNIVNAFNKARYFPSALFLSGCKTAQAVKQGALPSMAQTLADRGIASVIGWAKPVYDHEATQAAEIFYDQLATGSSVIQATFQVRNHMMENNMTHWHLLRCYGRPDSHQPLVTEIDHENRKIEPIQAPSREYFDSQNQIRVCHPEDYIGHRRLLQRCLKLLKTLPPCPQALLLHGAGGLGKSSTVLKLLHRFPDIKALVIVGELNEKRLINVLDAEFPNEQASKILTNTDISLSYRLRQFFIQHPKTYIVLDDFEQNIIFNDKGKPQTPITFTPNSLNTISSLMEGIRDSGMPAKLLITSRYEPPKPQGVEWESHLMSGLQGADFDKKRNRLTHTNDESLGNSGLGADKTEAKQILQRISAGNPRLLERLDALFSEQDKDNETLIKRLEKTEAAYREELVLEELYLSLPSDQRRLLAACSVYQILVPQQAIDALKEDFMSQTYPAAERLGLVEQAHRGKSIYEQCSPLLRPYVTAELSKEQWQQVQQNALNYAFKHWFEQQEETSEPYLKEIFRLALLCQDETRLSEITDVIASMMIEQYRHHEANQICEQALIISNDWKIHHRAAVAKQHLALDGVSEHYKSATLGIMNTGELSQPSQLKPRQLNLLYDYCQALKQQGDLDTSFKLLESILIPAYTALDDEREIAVMNGSLADILYDRGELDEALRIRKEEQIPVYERLKDVRSKAVTMGKIADILYARGELDEALRIRKEEQIPVFERLKDVRERALTMGKIADILFARGEWDEALRIRKEEQIPVYERLKDVRERAVTMGQIADILYARGELDEALRIRQHEEIPVYERLKDVRSKAVTMGKIADILYARGELDEALRIRQHEEIPVYERLKEVRERAVTVGKIADILYARGELDEALRILKEEQIPVYERLKDARSKAVTMGKIADILYARGELDEALRIRQHEEIPVYERLKEVRSKAVTMGQIADILYARGELDEALRIRKEEQIPVFERLKEVRSKAVTMGKIADILYARGELDEALRIRQHEEIPVYERLKEVRSKAVTMGKIADILYARGELDEALRIRQHEEIPVYERLKDVRSKAVTMGQIADILYARGELDEALRIRKEEQIPVFERLKDVRERAFTMGKIADILYARGELDEALRIRREEEIPVYERLGDVRSRLITQVKIAQILHQIDSKANHQKIHELMFSALNAALQMKIPEAETIMGMMLDMDLLPKELLEQVEKESEKD